MKKILLALAIALLSGCATLPYSSNVYVGDFSKYTKEGFIISPAYDGFKYDPISVISIEASEGYIVKKDGNASRSGVFGKSKMSGNDADKYNVIGKVIKDKRGKAFVEVGYYEILDAIVKKAKDMGANGILGLKITMGSKTLDGKPYYSLTASGFAVKIK